MNSDEVRRQWADRSGAYSPDYYAYYGPNETSAAIRERLDRLVEPTASVLELGCSSGRHLAHLREHGYTDLSGIDVNEDALDVMERTYPDLADAGAFYLDAIEDVVDDFEDDRFDAVYSVETLQHLHPDVDWVFEELVRLADDVLVTVENEGGRDRGGDGGDGDADGHRTSGETSVNYVHDEFPLYYRDWNRVFTDLGLVEVESASLDEDTLRVFRPADR